MDRPPGIAPRRCELLFRTVTLSAMETDLQSNPGLAIPGGYDYNYSQRVADRFEIIYDDQVARHLVAVERKYYALIKRTIEEHLAHQPDLETRNRKPLQRPSALGEVWELRFGSGNRFRVFYKFDLENKRVLVLAIGVKKGNRLVVGKEEFNL